MYCPHCGKDVGDNDEYCIHCGKSLSAAKAVDGVTKGDGAGTVSDTMPPVRSGKGVKIALIVIGVVFLLGLLGSAIEESQNPETNQSFNPNETPDLSLDDLEVARSRARDTKRIADVNQIRTAVELYFEDHNGTYPIVANESSLGRYLNTIPTDPLTHEPYGYIYGPDSTLPTQYDVLAELEMRSSALASDSDLKWTLTDGTVVDGAKESCTSAPGDCIYDQGTL